MFSHNFCFSIFAGVVVGGEFLKQCEISKFENFHNLRKFAGWNFATTAPPPTDPTHAAPLDMLAAAAVAATPPAAPQPAQDEDDLPPR